ncbi:MAG: immunity 53 family protein [Parachlamydiaceae bacterium]
MSTALDRFQKWYQSQKDEHYEITLDTLDHPGWFLKVYLAETRLQKKPFGKLTTDRTDDDWVHCRIKEDVFQGFGGPKNLEEILEVFLRWAEG